MKEVDKNIFFRSGLAVIAITLFIRRVLTVPSWMVWGGVILGFALFAMFFVFDKQDSMKPKPKAIARKERQERERQKQEKEAEKQAKKKK